MNDWALSFIENFDIQTETKAKNLSAEQLYNKYLSNKKTKTVAKELTKIFEEV